MRDKVLLYTCYYDALSYYGNVINRRMPICTSYDAKEAEQSMKNYMNTPKVVRVWVEVREKYGEKNDIICRWTEENGLEVL